eukprot:365596-Chlamydomonas_euryale.AAC.9
MCWIVCLVWRVLFRTCVNWCVPGVVCAVPHMRELDCVPGVACAVGIFWTTVRGGRCRYACNTCNTLFPAAWHLCPPCVMSTHTHAGGQLGDSNMGGIGVGGMALRCRDFVDVSELLSALSCKLLTAMCLLLHAPCACTEAT